MRSKTEQESEDVGTKTPFNLERDPLQPIHLILHFCS